MTRESRNDAGTEAALEALREALAQARRALAEADEAALEAERGREEGRPEPEPGGSDRTWRERLWTAPAEARIGVAELVEALGVSKSWVYARTRADADPRLPHSKIGGSLVFKAGELRAWVRDHEDVVEAYRMESAPGELRVESGGAG